MNDYKELIGELRNFTVVGFNDDGFPIVRYPSELERNAADAIEQLVRDNNVLTKERDAAREKQIAKKPQEKYEYMGNIGRGLNPMEYIKGYVCPTCGEWLDEVTYHCICGQAIDWSDCEYERNK